MESAYVQMGSASRTCIRQPYIPASGSRREYSQVHAVGRNFNGADTARGGRVGSTCRF